MQVQFINKQRKYLIKLTSAQVEAVLNELESHEALGRQLLRQKSESSLTVTFVGRTAMRQINASTRGIDRVTDVLSFPMLDMVDGQLIQSLQAADFDPSSGQPIVFLGDILICLDQANQQAEAYGHSFEREIAFLAAHGFLHLLGYDHDTPEREKKMLRRQRSALAKLGLGRGKKNTRNKENHHD